MATEFKLDPAQIAQWSQPLLLEEARLPDQIWQRLADYVELLGRWNQRMNLTAVRQPRELVERHVAECLRCAQLIPAGVKTLLDFGSGAGLPGIPILLARTEISVTLAESQTKKANFLREALRVLQCANGEVYGGRVEDMPRDRMFDAVVLRAVDNMKEAIPASLARISPQGTYALLTTEVQIDALSAQPNIDWRTPDRVPGSQQRVIAVGTFKG